MNKNMRPENKRMADFLSQNGIIATPKYLWDGSLKGCWRLYGKGQKWTEELGRKLSALGFIGFDFEPISKYAGNGGVFQVFVRGHNEFLRSEEPAPELPKVDCLRCGERLGGCDCE